MTVLREQRTISTQAAWEARFFAVFRSTQSLVGVMWVLQKLAGVLPRDVVVAQLVPLLIEGLHVRQHLFPLKRYNLFFPIVFASCFVRLGGSDK